MRQEKRKKGGQTAGGEVVGAVVIAEAGEETNEGTGWERGQG